MGLLADVRLLTNAATGDVSDSAINQALANNRAFFDHIAVEYMPALSTGGTLEWKKARIKPWGLLDPTISNGTTTVVTGGTISNGTGGTNTGNWTLSQDGIIDFATDQRGTVLYFTGYSYDKYAAAVEALEMFAANHAGEFDFKTDGQEFTASQFYDRLERVSELYRKKVQGLTDKAMRAQLATSLPDSCVVKRNAGTVDPTTGFMSDGWGAIGTVACRLSPVPLRKGEEGPQGGGVSALEFFMLTVPYDTDVTEKDQAVVNSTTWEVLSVDAHRSWQLAKRCTVVAKV